MPGVVWHIAHGCVVGMWFAGLLVIPAINELVELWQLPHSPVVGWFGSWASVGRVTIVTPYQVLPVSWQVAQVVPATGAWFIAVPPKLVNLAGAWQLSQAAVPTGMWVAGGVITVTPKKLLPVAWQVAHPVVMPVWFIVPPLNLSNFDGAWHNSQACVVGTWVAGGDTGTTLANVSPVAWQVAQPVVIPVWFIVARA